MTSFAALGASAFEGVWKVKDTAGNPFEITLSGGGAAKATRGEGMTGTWKEEGDSAIITWNTGWTTKITKAGIRYTKTAYGKGHWVYVGLGLWRELPAGVDGAYELIANLISLGKTAALRATPPAPR